MTWNKPTNVRRQRIKFSRHGDLAIGNCTLLIQNISYCEIMIWNELGAEWMVSVGTVRALRAACPTIHPQRTSGSIVHLSSLTRFRSSRTAHTASYSMDIRGSFPGCQAAGARSWPLTATTALVRNNWSYTSTPPYTFMVCAGITLLFFTSITNWANSGISGNILTRAVELLLSAPDMHRNWG